MPNKVGIELKPVQSVSNRVVPTIDVLEKEYANRYLQHIGVAITRDNVDTLLKELPIDKALVLPVWARGEMAIFPGLGNARKGDIEYIVKNMYKASHDDDQKGPRRRRNGANLKSKKSGSSATLSVGANAKEKAVDGDKEEGDGSGRPVSSNSVDSRESQQDKSEMKKTVNSPGGEASNTLRVTDALTSRKPRARLDAQPEVPRTSTPSGRKISWATVNTLDLAHYDVPMPETSAHAHKMLTRIELPGGDWLSIADVSMPQFKNMLNPPDFQASDMEGSIHLFCSSMGQYAPRVKEDKTGHLHDEVKKVLNCHLAKKLFGLLCHYTYWNILHPWVRDVLRRANTVSGLQLGTDNIGLYGSGHSLSSYPLEQQLSITLDSVTSLPTVDKEKLYQEVQETLITLLGKIGNTKTAIVTSQQSLVCCAHYAVDDLLSVLYPWLNCHAAHSAAAQKKTRRQNAMNTTVTAKTRAEIPSTPQTPTSPDSSTFSNSPNSPADEMPGEQSEVGFRTKRPAPSSSSKHKRNHVIYSKEACDLSLKVRRLMHQAIADLLDPSRLYTDHFLVASFVGSDKKPLKKMGGKGRFYVTSVAVRSVFGDAGNDCTRRFMQNRDDTYVPVPGIARKFDEKKAVEEDMREATMLTQKEHKINKTAHTDIANIHHMKSKKSVIAAGQDKSSGIPAAGANAWRSLDSTAQQRTSQASTTIEIQESTLDFKNIFGQKALSLADTKRLQENTLLGKTSSNAFTDRQVVDSSQQQLSSSGNLRPLLLPSKATRSPSGSGHTARPGPAKEDDIQSIDALSQMSIESASQAYSQHTNRSVVINNNAKFKVSLTVKARLMDKVVNHAASHVHSVEKVKKKLLYQRD